MLLLSRWKAADLYLTDINELVSELSMTKCNEAVRALAGEEHEPYRAILKPIRSLLQETIEILDAKLNGQKLAVKALCKPQISCGNRSTRVTNHCMSVAWA